MPSAGNRCAARNAAPRRRSLVVTLLAASAASALPGTAGSAELAGYLALGSDYVWRGVSQTDGDPSAQFGIDIAFSTGIFAGAWAATVDFDLSPFNNRDVELAYYAGYGVDTGDRWTLGARAVAFRYPGQEGFVDYEYEEYALSANFDDRLWFEYAYSPNLYNRGRDSHNVELYAETEIAGNLMLGGGVGHYDTSRAFGDSFNYWELGLTRSFGILSADLRYHDSDGYAPIVSSKSRSDARVVLTFRIVF